MATETENRISTVKEGNNFIYELNLKSSKALYNALDLVDQHAGNGYDFDVRKMLPAQEILTKKAEDNALFGRFYRLAKPIVLRIEIVQLKDGDPRSIMNLTGKLKANEKWTVNPIKETVV